MCEAFEGGDEAQASETLALVDAFAGSNQDSGSQSRVEAPETREINSPIVTVLVEE